MRKEKLSQSKGYPKEFQVGGVAGQDVSPVGGVSATSWVIVRFTTEKPEGQVADSSKTRFTVAMVEFWPWKVLMLKRAALVLLRRSCACGSLLAMAATMRSEDVERTN